MSTATKERRRTSAVPKDPGDHRAAAVATVKAIADQAADVWGAADGMTLHAWELLNTAADLGERLVERNTPAVIDHAGGLAGRIDDFHAALHGIRALIAETPRKHWTRDDVAAMDMIANADPELRDVLDRLEGQRHWEVDLGNKPADLPPPQVVQARAEPDQNPRFLMGQAMAVLQSAADRDDTSDVIFALRNLAEFCDQRVSEALESQRPIDYDMASAALVSMLDLMDILDAEKAGSTLFYAAQSLLQMAKTEIDAQWHALEQAEREAAHA